MTETVMVGLVGVYPLINIDNNLRIQSGPATEVELTTWVQNQIAAGSLIVFDSEGLPVPKPTVPVEPNSLEPKVMFDSLEPATSSKRKN